MIYEERSIFDYELRIGMIRFDHINKRWLLLYDSAESDGKFIYIWIPVNINR